MSCILHLLTQWGYMNNFWIKCILQLNYFINWSIQHYHLNSWFLHQWHKDLRSGTSSDHHCHNLLWQASFFDDWRRAVVKAHLHSKNVCVETYKLINAFIDEIYLGHLDCVDNVPFCKYLLCWFHVLTILHIYILNWFPKLNQSICHCSCFQITRIALFEGNGNWNTCNMIAFYHVQCQHSIIFWIQTIFVRGKTLELKKKIMYGWTERCLDVLADQVKIFHLYPNYKDLIWRKILFKSIIINLLIDFSFSKPYSMQFYFIPFMFLNFWTPFFRLFNSLHGWIQ